MTPRYRSTLLVIALLGTIPVAVPAVRAQEAPPNILIILTDDQRASGTMGVMPATRALFWGEGVRYRNAFATTPLCCPSRASIFTGRYAHNHGVHSNAAGDAAAHLDQGTTMQRYLQEADYRTAIFGKYFNLWDLSDDPPYFDRWAITSPSHASNGYYGGTWNVNGSLQTVDRYSTDYIADHGVAFIGAQEQNDDRPWFLELATYAPHGPATPEDDYLEAPVGRWRPDPSVDESDRRDKPPYVQATEPPRHSRIRKTRAHQLRTLMSVDDLVRGVFQALDANGETDRTLAFFLSDNGYLWGEHGLMAKTYPYAASIRIPFAVRWPGHISSGVTDKRYVATMDIAPTVLSAAGIAPDQDKPMDGRSLFDPWTRDRILTEFWKLQHPDTPPWASIRTASFKYVEYYDSNGAITFREYYDLESDPWELVNLLHNGVEQDDPPLAALHEQLTADRSCAGSACP